MSTHAKSPKPGTTFTRRFPRESEEHYVYEATAPLYASIGREAEAAKVQDTTTDISVLAVVKHRMELKIALDHRRLKPLTPYHPDAWESFLAKAGLSHKYQHIIKGLRNGFIINLPTISSTQAPPNRQSVIEFSAEFSRIVSHKFLKQRYIGPVSKLDLESLIGPFQSSPFSIIPKLGKLNKY
jgi:hypothetical protein